MSTAVLSIYSFTLKEGISDDDFLRASDKVQTVLNSFDGFQYRSVGKTEDGTWLEINYWQDQAKLAKLDEAFESNPDCAAFLGLINMESITAQKADVLYSGPAEEAA